MADMTITEVENNCLKNNLQFLCNMTHPFPATHNQTVKYKNCFDDVKLIDRYCINGADSFVQTFSSCDLYVVA